MLFWKETLVTLMKQLQVMWITARIEAAFTKGKMSSDTKSYRVGTGKGALKLDDLIAK